MKTISGSIDVGHLSRSASLNPDSVAREHMRSETRQTCFLIYSTRESHVANVIKRLTDFLNNDLDFSTLKLDDARVPGTQLLPEILKYTKECDMGIVILDGLRPNVVLELGMILANGTPCIILLEHAATVNVESLIADTGRRSKSIPQIKIDVSKHISDISNISWNEYSLQDDTAFRSLIRDEIRKLKPLMQKKQPHSHEKYSIKIKSLLRRIDNSAQLTPKGHLRLVLQARKQMQLLSKIQSAHISFHIARSFVRRNKLQTAFREVVRGLAFNPNYDQLLGLKGQILLGLGQPKEGLRILKRAISKNPGSKYLQQAHLVELILSNNPKAVLRILANKTYESLLIDNLIPIKAEALFLDGQVVASLKLLFEMYEYDTNKWAIHHVMFLLYNNAHGPLSKELVAQVEKYVRLADKRKHIKCYECFMRGCKAIGLTDLAMRFMHLWSKNEKGEKADSLNAFAYEFIELNEYKKAKTILQFALKKFPNDSYLNATWGLYKLFVENDLNAGKKFYSKAIELKPGDMPLERMYRYQLGGFYMRCGNKVQAKNYYTLALEVKTDFKQGEIQRALATLSLPTQSSKSSISSTGSRRNIFSAIPTSLKTARFDIKVKKSAASYR